MIVKVDEDLPRHVARLLCIRGHDASTVLEQGMGGWKDAEIWKVLNNNIVCANALDPNHNGWNDVGYMWEGKKPEQQFLDYS